MENHALSRQVARSATLVGMLPCDLCQTQAVARIAHLGERATRRAWLCRGCFDRYQHHELDPAELLTLARRAARRSGQCEWCSEAPPAASVQVAGAEGRVLALHLCPACAERARQSDGARLLHPQAALEGDETRPDPRYERAVRVAQRRRELRRIK